MSLFSKALYPGVQQDGFPAKPAILEKVAKQSYKQNKKY